jgi:hypothetical protein
VVVVVGIRLATLAKCVRTLVTAELDASVVGCCIPQWAPMIHAISAIATGFQRAAVMVCLFIDSIPFGSWKRVAATARFLFVASFAQLLVLVNETQMREQLLKQ